MKDIKPARNLLEIFILSEVISGLKVNTEKTEAIGIGKSEYIVDETLGINWRQDSIKITGVYFSYDENINRENNFNQSFKKLKNTLKVWNTRHLNLLDKVYIVKTL